MKAKRLFDLLQIQLNEFPLDDMLVNKEQGEWRKRSTHDVFEIVNSLSAGLLGMGISSGDGSIEGRDKVAIISKNRAEWVITDFAVQQIGAILVPLYPNISEQEMEFILKDAQVKLVFVNDQSLYDSVNKIRENVPSLQAVITYEKVPHAKNWQDLLQEVKEDVLQTIQNQKDKITEHDLTSILYTSGTTGSPKGVMLSHQNFLSDLEGIDPITDDIGIKGERALSFLPLNHAFERLATYCYIKNHVSIYYAEGVETIGDNLKEVQPVIFTTVPRLLEKVYEKILEKGAELSGFKKIIFDRALKLAEQYDVQKNNGILYDIQLAIYDKLVFSKWREALGGKVRAIIAGAAAVPVHLLKIFAAAEIIILEGYGMTETAPIISANWVNKKKRKFGTVGSILHNVEIKIAYDGEILCKGPMVMMGYYKRPDLTDEVMDGEWLHTGDIGEIIEDDFLKITDRKKDLFKTSGGKYVAPQAVEIKLMESPWVQQVMVVGAERKFVAALIVPTFEMIEAWYQNQGLEYPGNEVVVKKSEVYNLIKENITPYNNQLNPVEQVKKFTLLAEEWTIDDGELTPTLKLKRRTIVEKHAAEIEELYA